MNAGLNRTTAVGRVAFERGKPAPSMKLDTGRYAFSATARNTVCEVLATGCTAVDVPSTDEVAIGLGAAIRFAIQVRALARETRDLRVHAQELGTRLEASRADAERWRRDAGELIAGLGAAIDRQLDRWGLSAAEKEVALLLLKGLSHKEIADVRKVGETTVRHQARALYRKAGLSGRSDLAAFFLEDLLGPAPVERREH
jgi:DNA-binding CsgD family transcriptional regulator